jgi:hypothetical protein
MSGITRTRTRLALAPIAFAGISMLTACLKSTAPQASTIDLDGSWHYAAVQNGPVRETLDGTMTISNESGTSFQGQMVFTGVNSQTGLSRVLSGSVSGSESGPDVIDFDANVESPARRHVGRIVADTITGTWIGGTSTDGTMSSGTFKLERETR